MNTFKSILLAITLFFSALVFGQSFQPQNKEELQSAVTSWYQQNETALSNYGEINSWDVSLITDMSNLFQLTFDFNDDISDWDVSNVTNMEGMFSNTNQFNQLLDDWDVSNVTNMLGMFANSQFNQPLDSWNVSSVTNMNYMFQQAHQFNQPLNSWDVSNVINMTSMFSFSGFNQDLSNWDVSNVTSMHNAFTYNDALSDENKCFIESTWSSNSAWPYNWSSEIDCSQYIVFQPQNKEELQTAVNLWIDDNTTALSTYGEINNWDVSLVTNMRQLFQNKVSFNSDISNWDVSSVVNMFQMFDGATSFNSDISNWNVSNVTNMGGTFRNAQSFDKPLNNWNVSNVTNMSGLFERASSFNQPLNLWDVSNVAGMSRLFEFASSFNNNISTWDVSSVTDMSFMFHKTPFDQDISDWNVSNVRTFQYMFLWNELFNSDLSQWDVSNCTNFSSMFQFTNFNQDISDWDVSSALNIERMFQQNPNFNQDLSGWNVSNVTRMAAAFYLTTSFESDLSNWDVSKVTNMNALFAQATSFESDLSNWDVSNVVNMDYMFGGVTFSPNVSSWDVSSVTQMASMFSDASQFDEDISQWNVSNVVNMNNMFLNADLLSDENKCFIESIWSSNSAWPYNWASEINCTQLLAFQPQNKPELQTAVDLWVSDNETALSNYGEINSWDVSLINDMSNLFNGKTTFDSDISNWDVSNVTSMINMFYNATAFNQDISLWNVSNVIDMQLMFRLATSFNGDLSNWDVSNVTNMKEMFTDAHSFEGVNGLDQWNVSSVNNAQGLTRVFESTLFNQDISSWDVSNAVNMWGMFRNNTKFNQDLSSWNISNVHTISMMFKGATSFDQDLSAWDVSNVNNMEGVFDDAQLLSDENKCSIESVWSSNSAWPYADWSNLCFQPQNKQELRIAVDLWISDNETALSSYGEINTWDVSLITSMEGLFASKTTFNADISNWDVSNVTNMKNMFLQAHSFNLQYITGWNVSSVSTMAGMFYDKIVDVDLTGWDVSNVTNMGFMFESGGCSDSGNISNWNTSNVTTMIAMFAQQSVINCDITNWDVSNVGDFEAMFLNTNFNQDISNWNISSAVYRTSNMFSGNNTFNQDLSNWDVSNVTSMHNTFNYTNALSDENKCFIESTWSSNSAWPYNWASEINCTQYLAFKPQNKEELQTAVNLWVSDNETALSSYGEINSWDVSLITDMSTLFKEKTSFNDDISNWDVSNVTNMTAMFKQTNFNQDISSWNVSNVIDMSRVFSHTNVFNQDISAWDVSNVLNMREMFYIAQGFNQDLSSWNISNVTNMNVMFFGTGLLSDENKCSIESAWSSNSAWPYADWSNLCTSESGSGCTDLYAANYNEDASVDDGSCYGYPDNGDHAASYPSGGVNTIIVNDSPELRIQGAMTTEAWFKIDADRPTDWVRIVGKGNSGPRNYGLWYHPNGTVLWQQYGGGNTSAAFNVVLESGVWYHLAGVTDSDQARVYLNGELVATDDTPTLSPDISADPLTIGNAGFHTWHRGLIDEVRVWNVARSESDIQESMAQMLSGLEDGLVGYWKFNTGNGGIAYDHSGSSNHGTLNAVGWSEETPNYNDFISFKPQNRAELKAAVDFWVLDKPAALNTYGNITNWDVSLITDMHHLFSGKNSFNDDISGWDVSSVTTMSYMFEGASLFNQDISGWDVSNVTNMFNMLVNAVSFNQPIGVWNVSNVTDMQGLLAGCTNFNHDMSSWNVSNVTNMRGMFSFSGFNQDITSWNVSNVTSMKEMFWNNNSFNYDISTWDVSNVNNFSIMFDGTGSLDNDTKCNIHETFSSNTAWVYDWSSYCGSSVVAFKPETKNELQSAVNLWTQNKDEAIGVYGDINTWDVSLMTDLGGLFMGNRDFNEDISSWDVSNVTNLADIFHGAGNFSGDISSWNVSSVVTMANMAKEAMKFNSDLSAWDVSNVTDMSKMFYHAYEFDSDISGWDVSSVGYFVKMFEWSIKMASDLSTWDVSSAVNMAEMFRSAEIFNSDISGWNVSSVATMAQMFKDATSFDQDLSGWDVSNVNNFNDMFLRSEGLSDENRCSIHESFSFNENWVYDWIGLCTSFEALIDTSFSQKYDLSPKNWVIAIDNLGQIRLWGDVVPELLDVPGVQGFVAVSAGFDHAVALDSSGQVYAWGRNGKGQIDVPSDLIDVVQISAGPEYTVVLQEDGSVRKWGNNWSGGDWSSEVPEDLGNTVKIDAHYWSILALSDQGTVRQWGASGYGLMNEPTNTNFVDISAGAQHALALTAEGQIIGWGRSDYGQITVPGENNFIGISAGSQNNIAYKDENIAIHFGYNTENSIYENIVDAKISSQPWFSIAVQEDGSLLGSGNNANGQLDFPDNFYILGSVPPSNGCTDVLASNYDDYAMNDDGSCHGYPDAGEHSLSFNGSNNSVFVSGDYLTTEVFSFETWIYPTNLDGWRAIRNENGWSAGYIHYQFLNKKLEFSLNGNAPTDQWFDRIFEPGEWYHLALVYDGVNKKVTLYVNGEFEQEKAYSNTRPAIMRDFNFGFWGGRPFAGEMSEFRIWDRTLTADEVANNMNVELSGHEDGLFGYWKFDAGEGQIAYDHSGNAHHGTINGATWGAEVPTLNEFVLIPDNNFERALIDLGHDDIVDGQVMSSVIGEITHLNVCSNEISSLQGIDRFINLESLIACNNQLVTADLSSNLSLKLLELHNNQITSVNVSQNTLLENFSIEGNQLTSIDVSNNPLLYHLDLSGSPLGTVDLSNNLALRSLHIGGIQVDQLDLSNHAQLETVNVGGNSLSVIDVSSSEGLKYLNVNGNVLTELNLTENPMLEVLFASHNQLTLLDVSNNSMLRELFVADNDISGIDVAAADHLERLEISNNSNIEELNVSRNEMLKHLHMNVTSITNINVSSNPILETLHMSEHNISSINLNNNPALKHFYAENGPLQEVYFFGSLDEENKNKNLEIVNVHQNQLTEVNVSELDSLKELIIGFNQLTSLDVSHNSVLERLWCAENQLQDLDLSNNPHLKYFSAFTNPLQSLNLKNGAIENFGEGQFEVYGTPELSCILTDNSNWATENLTVDDGVTFDSQCAPTGFVGIPDEKFEQKLIDLGHDDLKDGLVRIDSIENITWLDLEFVEVANLDGITKFTSLEGLNCDWNKLTKVDIYEPMPALEHLSLAEGDIAEINLTGAMNLKRLFITGNELREINLEQVPNLEQINISGNKFEDIDFSAAPLLEYVSAHFNQLREVKVNNNPNLRELRIGDNQLSGVDISNNPLLEQFNIVSNPLDGLDISNNPEIRHFEAFNCSLSELDMSNNPNIEFLHIAHNRLEVVDVSNMANLHLFIISDNSVVSLDVSNNTNLAVLGASDLEIENIDVSNNPMLTELIFSNTYIQNIDLSNNEMLEYVEARQAGLMSLNLSYSPNLHGVVLSDNNLTSLNLKNGNTSQIHNFNVTNNRELYCINVSDPAWASENWGFPDNTDRDVIFSGFCSDASKTDWYVSNDGSDENGDGDINSPLASIQLAIEAATEGDTVFIGPGVYMENLTWVNKNLILLGSGSESTTLDAQGIDNGIRIQNLTSNSKLQGITVTNGTTLSENGWPWRHGGGISVVNAHLTFKDVIVENSILANAGGWGKGNAMHISNSTSLFEDVIIRNNEGGGIRLSGGGAYPTFNRVEITDNYGGYGMEVYDTGVIMDSSIVARNVDGGIWYEGVGFKSSSYSNTLFMLNGDGSTSTGAIYLYNRGGDAHFENCTFYENLRNGDGNDIYSRGEHFNDSFYGNDISVLNSAFYNSMGSSIYLHQNSSYPDTLHMEYSSLLTMESLHMDNVNHFEIGENTIEADPMFCNPNEDDFTVSHISELNGGALDGGVIGAYTVGCGLNPSIVSITDVPNDQGGRVYLSFNRSFMDSTSFSGGFYTVYREDLINDELTWVSVLSGPAIGETTYTFELMTLKDSTAIDDGLTHFKVASVVGEDILYSDIASGYSVDNIVPAVPTGLNAVASIVENSGGWDRVIELQWDGNIDDDFQYFQIERSDNIDFVESVVVFETIDSYFTDYDISSNMEYFYRVRSVDDAENMSDFSEVASAIALGTESELIPTEFALFQNYPNPFNPFTTIQFRVIDPVNVSLNIYDLSGKQIKTLVNSFKNSGKHQVVWDATNNLGQSVAAGMYIYTIQAGDFNQTKKMLLLK